ncbi:MAG: hypothetical protein UY42_C0004G0029, partial [Parcubacteria group bacterium GW2011_GWA2_49_16]
FLDLAGVKFFLKVERTFFFGVLPSRSRAGGGTIMFGVAEQFGWHKEASALLLAK